MSVQADDAADRQFHGVIAMGGELAAELPQDSCSGIVLLIRAHVLQVEIGDQFQLSGGPADLTRESADRGTLSNGGRSRSNLGGDLAKQIAILRGVQISADAELIHKGFQGFIPGDQIRGDDGGGHWG